eukprot:GHVO01068724.1.p1 GENE.GHVO01068724.1~~GHVO01068724.1.p1  ORF type:complete len:290 (+),score=35.19 GHVO01068724.1:119-871(+)
MAASFFVAGCCQLLFVLFPRLKMLISVVSELETRRLMPFHKRFIPIILAIASFLGIMILLFAAPLYPLLLFVWVPQIYSDLWNGTHYGPSNYAYIIILSLWYFCLPAYWWLYPPSMLNDASLGLVSVYVPNNIVLGVACGVIMAAQIILIGAQLLFGPRCFVRLAWLPHVYDYKRMIDPGQLAKVMGASEQQDPSKGGLDCVICIGELDVSNDKTVVTPCDHFFHDTCLRQWMEVKMECPFCRHPLPPFA